MGRGWHKKEKRKGPDEVVFPLAKQGTRKKEEKLNRRYLKTQFLRVKPFPIKGLPQRLPAKAAIISKEARFPFFCHSSGSLSVQPKCLIGERWSECLRQRGDEETTAVSVQFSEGLERGLNSKSHTSHFASVYE